MGSLLDLASHLAGAAHKLGGDEHHEAFHHACELLVTEIKSAIGTYRYGWPALAESTLARKGADTPLLESGAYQASFRYILGHNEAWVGTDDPKVNWFEHGTSRMPPRPVLLPALTAKEHEIAIPFVGVLSATILGR